MEEADTRHGLRLQAAKRLLISFDGASGYGEVFFTQSDHAGSALEAYGERPGFMEGSICAFAPGFAALSSDFDDRTANHEFFGCFRHGDAFLSVCVITYRIYKH
jgi:hypothetical protein